jgi:glycosyltransferase involved in cell wall biosynthesis
VPLILSVGRLVEKKGFPVLLRAAALLAQARHQLPPAA